MTKVSVYIDDKVWANFKRKVFQKHGGLRKISSEVEMLLRSQIIEDAIVSGFKKVGIEVKGTISSSDVKARRPKLKGPPSEEIVKEMRRRTVAETLHRH